MGVKDLWKILDYSSETIELRDLSGKVLAVGMIDPFIYSKLFLNGENMINL